LTSGGYGKLEGVDVLLDIDHVEKKAYNVNIYFWNKIICRLFVTCDKYVIE
jgi:hypothetical protein